MSKKNRIITAVSAVLIVATAAYSLLSIYFAGTIAKPSGLSYEEEREWSIEHGLWGDSDSYEKEAYSVSGLDGYKLNCSLIRAESDDSDKFVIISHGFRSNMNGAMKYVDVYRSLGYSCIIYDVRAHGENEDAICSLGNFESEDLYLLIADTYERYGGDISLGLHGESMGSAISLSVLAKKNRC